MKTIYDIEPSLLRSKDYRFNSVLSFIKINQEKYNSTYINFSSQPEQYILDQLKQRPQF